MNFLFFPLLSGFLFPFGSLLLKRSAERGVGPWRMTFVCNLALAAVAPLFLIGGPAPVPGAVWWHPVVVGAVFFAGQIFSFLAIDRGDVTVATPVFGAKAVFVAFLLTVLIGSGHVSPALWTAALLTTLAVALLGGGGTPEHRNRFLFTLVTAGLAAFFFSCGDVLTQKWAPAWGAARFTAYEFAVCAAMSPFLIPLFHRPLREIDRVTWRWLLAGGVVNALQATILYVTIGHFGHATEANVIYNARSLWTLFLVWAVGHWFGNRERHAGTGVMVRRLVGSLLLLAAIGLVAHGKTG